MRPSLNPKPDTKPPEAFGKPLGKEYWGKMNKFVIKIIFYKGLRKPMCDHTRQAVL
jgi:hypothetical protein